VFGVFDADGDVNAIDDDEFVANLQRLRCEGAGRIRIRRSV
jgi:hypothetical protein